MSPSTNKHIKTITRIPDSCAPSRFLGFRFAVALQLALLLALSAASSYAGTAIWKTNPVSGDWNNPSNWTPETVPNGPSDAATFGQSSLTNISIPNSIEVSDLVFTPGASAFDLAVVTNDSMLTISGGGITNNSGVVQSLVNQGTSHTSFVDGIVFKNAATAGNMVTFTTRPSTFTLRSGVVFFRDTSSAGSASFINQGGRTYGTGGGFESFSGNSTAANATILNEPGMVDNTSGGDIAFFENATASHATIVNEGATVSGARGGSVYFYSDNSAGSAVLMAEDGSNGGTAGTFRFFFRSTGSVARAILSGDGNLDITGRNVPGTMIGSIEGDGHVFLGANNLAVGSNNLNTVFSGVISDGGRGPRHRGGSLSKIGQGKLVLQRRNHYTGGTTVKSGKLVVNNLGRSGTGTGPVQVEGGKLAGEGMIAGAVTIGTGSGPGAVLAPGYLHGVGRPGALTIQSPLTFNSDGPTKWS